MATAEQVAELGRKADTAITRATTAAKVYAEALEALPVRELLRLARLRGHAVGHDARTRDVLLARLREPA